MNLFVFQRTAVTEQGNVIPNAEITVYAAGTTTEVDLFDDAVGTPKVNPFNAGPTGGEADGFIQFYVAFGNYDIAVNGTVLWENQTIGRPELSDITFLSSLNTAALVDGQQFRRKEFWSGTGVGGVDLYWDASRPVSEHTGGTIIDPAKISELDTVNKTFGTYFTADTVSGNTGCFVVHDVAQEMSSEIFGTNGPTPAESTKALNAMLSAASGTGRWWSVGSGTYLNVVVNGSDFNLKTLSSAVFKAEDSSLEPAILFNGCSNIRLSGVLKADGNKANNPNSFDQSDSSASTSTIGVLSSSDLVFEGVECINAYHDGFVFDKTSGVVILGKVNSFDSNNRGITFTDAASNIEFTGKIETARSGAHNIRFGSLSGSSDVDNIGMKGILTYDGGLDGVGSGVLVEIRSNNIRLGDVVSYGNGGTGIKIEEATNTAINYLFAEDNVLDGLTLARAKRCSVGSLNAVGNGSHGLNIDTTGGSGFTNDITVSNVTATSNTLDGVLISNAAAATEPLATQRVTVTNIISQLNGGIGLRINSGVNFVCVSTAALQDNADFDFRIQPGASGIAWSSMVFGTASGQAVGASGSV